MWWNDDKTAQESKNTVIEMLKTKQVEFVLAGWTMPDEATTSYVALLETITRGHRWLADTFGDDYLPTTSWRIDPFGLSPAVTRLYHDTGLNRSIIMRIPFDVDV